MPQHDMVIANGSGAAVRADINDALAAIGSMMKGPNAPPAPVAGMLWLDDDTPSTTVWTVRQYDGAEWIECGRLDITNNVFIPSEGVIAWADVASAATVDLGAQASRSLRLTGTNTISSFGTAASGTRRRLRIATGLTITHNPSNIICPGAVNLVLLAGDVLDVESLGAGVWVVVDLQPAAGYVVPGLITGSGLTIETASVLGRVGAGSGAIQRIPLANPAAAVSLGINRGTAQATTSGTSIDFLGIPAGVRQIIVLLRGVSISGTDDYLIQIGSGSFLTSGYASAANSSRPTSTPTSSTSTSGFVISSDTNSATRVFAGRVTLHNITGNIWVADGLLMSSDGIRGQISSGEVSLSGDLDRLRLTVTGSNNYDLGQANLLWSF